MNMRIIKNIGENIWDIILLIPIIPSIIIDYLTNNWYFPNITSDRYSDYHTNRREGVRQMVIVICVVIFIFFLLVKLLQKTYV